jgi:hypothetical protein
MPGAGAKCAFAVLTPAVMRHRTRDLRGEIARLNRLIARIRAKPGREWMVWSATLHDLME